MTVRLSKDIELDVINGNGRIGPTGRFLIPGSFGSTGLGKNGEGLQVGADVRAYRGPNGELLLDPPLTTTADIEWYIDAVNGDDASGDGSAGLPWASFHCLDLLKPLTIAHQVKINIAPGTYTYFPRFLDFNFVDKEDGTVGRLIFDSSTNFAKIVNTDFVAHAPVNLGPVGPHGKALGTRIEFDEAPLWTLNEYSNKWIYWKTGPAAGTFYPIHHCDNFGGLSFLHTWQNFGNFAVGNTFNLVDPAVIISPDQPLTIRGKRKARVGVKWTEEEREEPDLTPNYVFAGIKFDFQSSVRNPVIIDQSTAAFYFCTIQDNYKGSDNSVCLTANLAFCSARLGIYDNLLIPDLNNIKLRNPSVTLVGFAGDLTNTHITSLSLSDSIIEGVSTKHLIEIYQGYNWIFNSITDALWCAASWLNAYDVFVETLGNDDIFDMWNILDKSRAFLYSVYFWKSNSVAYVEDSYLESIWLKSNNSNISTDYAIYLTGFSQLRRDSVDSDATGALGAAHAIFYNNETESDSFPWPAISVLIDKILSPENRIVAPGGTTEGVQIGTDCRIYRDGAGNLAFVPALPVVTVQYPPNFLSGLLVERNSNTILTLGYGSARDTYNGADIYQDVMLPLTKTVDITVSGAGGLDTGSRAANTWYYIHLIKNPTSGAVNGLISLSATAPTLPAGYTVFRRIGVWKTDAGSNWHLIKTSGNGMVKRYQWEIPWTTTRVLSAGTATIFTAVNLSAYVPPVSKVVELGTHFYVIFALPNALNGARFRPGGSGESDPVWKCCFYHFSTDTGQETLIMPCSNSQIIEYRNETPSSGTCDTTVWVIGFEDSL